MKGKERKGQEGRGFRQSTVCVSYLFQVTSAEAGCPGWLLPSSGGASVRLALPAGTAWSGLAAVRLPEPPLSLLTQFLASSLLSQGLTLSVWSLQTVFPAGKPNFSMTTLKSTNSETARPS